MFQLSTYYPVFHSMLLSKSGCFFPPTRSNTFCFRIWKSNIFLYFLWKLKNILKKYKFYKIEQELYSTGTTLFIKIQFFFSLSTNYKTRVLIALRPSSKMSCRIRKLTQLWPDQFLATLEWKTSRCEWPSPNSHFEAWRQSLQIP